METTDHLTVDLYVRADTPLPERRSTVIDRLRRLERTDRIAGFTVHPWPRAVSLDLVTEIDDESVLGVFRSLESGADRRGHSIRPPFDVHTARSAITGETDELLVLPVICLAVNRNQELIGVFPCRERGSVLTVGDALDAIATGDETVLGSPPGDEASAAEERVEGEGDADERPPRAVDVGVVANTTDAAERSEDG